MAVPANTQVLAKLNAYEVDCNWDYVQFSVQGKPPLMTLCPPPTSSKIYAMNPVPNGELTVINFITFVRTTTAF